MFSRQHLKALPYSLFCMEEPHSPSKDSSQKNEKDADSKNTAAKPIDGKYAVAKTANAENADAKDADALSLDTDTRPLLPFERVKRQVLVRRDMETLEKYGTWPEKRTIAQLFDYGIINIDKPSGPSSHQVSAYVQKILNIEKSGHSGTLDPGVTGCLPVALGKATRVVQSLLNAGKEYICIMHIHQELPEEKVKETLRKFVGKIKQLPPVKSAVKRQWRYRKIYYLNFIEMQGKNVLFITGTQAGTYIRKLVHDIGQELGCGAHMLELRRTKAGPFSEKNIVKMQDLADAYHYYKENGDETLLRRFIMPFEFGISHLGKLWVFDTTVDSLCHGASLKVPGIAKVDSDIQLEDPVAILTLKGELVAVGVARMISQDIAHKDHGIAATLSQVFMNPGVYPKMDNKSPDKSAPHPASMHPPSSSLSPHPSSSLSSPLSPPSVAK